VVVISTIPPRYDNAAYIARSADFAAAIREVAQARQLPLIDLHAEILARRSGTSWQGTLVDAGNGYTLTAAGAGYVSNDDIYKDGGDITAHRTGAAAANVGYLLRNWLTVQKLKEIKLAIADSPRVSTGIELSGGGTTTAGTTTGGTTTGGTTTAGSTAGTATAGGTYTGTPSKNGALGCGGGAAVPAAIGLALALFLRRLRD
jgi:hypothetical protein